MSVFCRFDDLLHIGLTVQITVFTSVNTDQFTVVILLNTAAALLTVVKGKSDHVARQCTVRIKSAVLVLKPYTFDTGGFTLVRELLVHLVCQFFKRFFFINRKLAGKLYIIRLAVLADRIKNRLSVITKHFTKGLHRRFQIFFRSLIDLVRIQDQVVHLLTGGQIRTVSVHNIASSVRDRTTVEGRMLVQHDLGIFFIFIFDQIIENCHKTN